MKGATALCTAAKQKYHICLEDQRHLKQDEQKAQKKQRTHRGDNRDKAMEEALKVLLKPADQNAEKADCASSQVQQASKSCNRKRLEDLQKQLTDKLKEL